MHDTVSNDRRRNVRYSDLSGLGLFPVASVFSVDGSDEGFPVWSKEVCLTADGNNVINAIYPTSLISLSKVPAASSHHQLAKQTRAEETVKQSVQIWNLSTELMESTVATRQVIFTARRLSNFLHNSITFYCGNRASHLHGTTPQ